MIQKLAIKTITPIAAALFLFTVLFTASSNAETWVRCDACSLSQSEALAIAVGPEQDVVIFSASNNTAQAYWTRTEVSGAGCEPLRPGQNRTQKGVVPKSQNAISAGQCSYTTVAQSVPLDVSKEQLLDAFHGAYVETNGTMQKNAQVNIADIPNAPTGPGAVANDPRGITAYDVRNNVATQVALRDAATAYVLSAQGQLNHLVAMVVSLVNVRLVNTSHQINLVITLADGSKVQFNFTSQRDDAELVDAKDPSGTPVMEVGTPPVLYVGTFNYQSNQDVNNFLRNAALNGVRIVDHHIGGNSATCHSEIKENGEVIVTCQPS